MTRRMTCLCMIYKAEFLDSHFPHTTFLCMGMYVITRERIMAWSQSYVRNLSLQVRGILNKLTPEKFQKLSDDLLQTELNSGVILKGVILLVSIATGTF